MARARERKPSLAFTETVWPSPALAASIGDQPGTRPAITVRLWDYISKHGLQDHVNRRMINPDAKFAPFFGGRPRSMFEMTKLIDSHLSTEPWSEQSKGGMASLADAETTSRNPPWTREELILALHLYLSDRRSPPSKSSTAVIELSEFINRMSAATSSKRNDTFRNPAGVYMKMMNFRRFDPEYTGSGKVGLTRGNKDEAHVWQEYSSDPMRLATTVAAIRKAVEEVERGETTLADSDDAGAEAEEGRVLTRLHRVRERSRALVEKAKSAAQRIHGKLTCEACGFDFVAFYGPAGSGVIEVHHRRPLHTIAAQSKTKLEDLALLCANCHRVIHAQTPWLTVESLQTMLKAKKPSKP